MARDIEAMFVGEVREGTAIYRLQPSAATWDGEYHYQDARYLFHG